RSLLGIVIVSRKSPILMGFHLIPQHVDARVFRNIIFVVGSSKSAENQRYSNHILDTMVAVGRIIQRPFLVDDTDGGLMCADTDMRNISRCLAPFTQFTVQSHGSFHRGLGVELCREGNFKEDMLHHVRTVWPLELECV